MILSSFAKDLLQFTRALDRVDARLLDAVRDAIVRHLQYDKNIIYFEVMEEGDATSGRVLKTVWRLIEGKLDQDELITVIGSQEPLDSHGSLAIVENKEIWIVGEERGKPLEESEQLLDKWNEIHIEGRARYKPPTGVHKKACTSIIVPIRYHSDPIGVFDLETSQYLEPVKVAKEELLSLADALGTLYGLRQVVRHPDSLTSRALDDIENKPYYTAGPRLTKPSLFFAWPHKAITHNSSNHEVVSAIEKVLGEFSEYIHVVNWQSVKEDGNISQQVLKAILSASYGVCYFSEPSTDGKYKYLDNANVVFEAGMLHSICNVPTEIPMGWIPIREMEPLSPKPPFDFAQERILEVPREKDDGGFQENIFITELRKRVQALLNS